MPITPKKKHPVQTKLTNLKVTEETQCVGNNTIKNTKQTKKEFVTLKPNAIFSDLRKFENKPQKMISTIERNVFNDFALYYTIKPKKEIRYSQRNHMKSTKSIIDYVTPKEVNFAQYQRCVLEDFMELKQNTHIYVVAPSDHPIARDESLDSVGTISFNKIPFKVYSFNHIN